MSFILTAAEMRAAEERAIAAGTSAATLMERAGAGAAEAIWRFAGPLPALVLCGPGNNGGDGYVIARLLAERGVAVRVGSLGQPTSQPARAMRGLWTAPVEPLDEAEPMPLLIDALFGTGLTRPLESAATEALSRLAAAAQVRVAIDLPSGAATDEGSLLSPVPDHDLTVTFGALKPAHLLQPAARHVGRILVCDIGLEAASALSRIERPRLRTPGPDDHKYTRGIVTIMAGHMAGASALAAAAAARSGAGAVRLQAQERIAGVPHAIVQSPGAPLDRIGDHRIGALLLGPGLPVDAEGRELLDAALAGDHPLVLDAGALRLLAERGLVALAARTAPAILTPHQGEFDSLFGKEEGTSKVERARRAASASRAIIVFKGADTVVAAPDGRAAIASGGSPWLATAGSGDVLAGIVAALLAARCDPFAAACGGVWLHNEAGHRAGPNLIADDIVAHLSEALSECL